MMRFVRRYGAKILIGLVLVAALYGAVGVWAPYQRELRITSRIKLVGGEVIYRYVGPTWFSKSIQGRLTLFDRIEGVEFFGDETPPEVLSELRSLSNLERLDFTHSEITDAGLEQIKQLTKLRLLNLRHTEITDVGLAQLTELRNLSFLQLDDTVITDAGLEHLKGMAGLRFLHIKNTDTTAEGREQLRKALPNCKIEGGS